MKTQRARRGTVLIEAALLLPIIIFLTFAMMEYGWILLKSYQLSNAARHGARIAVRADSTAGEVTSEIDTLMASAGITGYSTSIDPGVDVERGESVTVEIQIPYDDNNLVGGPLVPTPANLKASVSMAKEGP